jgi:hypothetical protein
VLRAGLSAARASLALSDGTRIEVDELVGTLHFWNEHQPRYSEKGSDLGWACAVRDRVVQSLRAFSDHIESKPAWREVQAVRTETALPARLGAIQVGRVFQSYGFERVPRECSFSARLHGVGECFVLWGLTRAFNPAALPRQPFLRDRHELWISRATLLARYARRNSRIESRTSLRRGAWMPVLLVGGLWAGLVAYLLFRALRQFHDYQNATLVKVAGRSDVSLVSIIVPARNEIDNIAACLSGLTQQSYLCAGSSIIVVDDDSQDGTAAMGGRQFPDRPGRGRRADGTIWSGRWCSAWRRASTRSS